MKYSLITTTFSLLIVGSIFAISFEPLTGFGYGYTTQTIPPMSTPSYGYGYGTTTTPSTDTTTTESTGSDSSSTGDVLTDVDHDVVEEVPSNNTTDQTTETDEVISSDEACSIDEPSHLKVRQRKRRLILRWRGSNDTCPTSSVAGYIVRIKTKRGKLVLRTDTVEQLQYRLKRQKLQTDKVYTFSVRTVLETGEKSGWSKQKRFHK